MHNIRFVASSEKVDERRDLFDDLNELTESFVEFRINMALIRPGTFYVINEDLQAAEQMAEILNKALESKINALIEKLQKGWLKISTLEKERYAESVILFLKPYEKPSSNPYQYDEQYIEVLNALFQIYEDAKFKENESKSLEKWFRYVDGIFKEERLIVLKYLWRDYTDKMGEHAGDLFKVHIIRHLTFPERNEESAISALKLLEREETVLEAKGFRERKQYRIVVDALHRLFDVLQEQIKITKNGGTPRSLSSRQSNEEEFSDVLYWEAVHEGEILPEELQESYNSNSYYGSSSYDDYGYDYDMDTSFFENKTMSYLLDRKLGPYLEQLLQADEEDVSEEEKIRLLNRLGSLNVFEGSLFKGKLNLQKEKAVIKERLEIVADQFGLTFLAGGYNFQLYRSYDFEIELIHSESLELTRDGVSNHLIINIRNGYRREHSLISLQVFSAGGVEFGEEYIAFLEEHMELDEKGLLKSGMSKKKFPNGILLELIGGGNREGAMHIRQFYSKKDN